MSRCERCGYDFGDGGVEWMQHANINECVTHLSAENDRLRRGDKMLDYLKPCGCYDDETCDVCHPPRVCRECVAKQAEIERLRGESDE